MIWWCIGRTGSNMLFVARDYLSHNLLVIDFDNMTICDGYETHNEIDDLFSVLACLGHTIGIDAFINREILLCGSNHITPDHFVL